MRYFSVPDLGQIRRLLGAGSGLAALVALPSRAVEQWLGSRRAARQDPVLRLAWWWYIPESGIYHQSKLTQQGLGQPGISQPRRRGSAGPGSAPRSVTMGGPTVDAATATACRHLGVPLSTVRVEVLDYGGPERPFQAAELARVFVTER